MERCPSCRCRLNASALCPRCGCDLSLIFAVETRAESLLRQTIRAWADGNPASAAARLEESLALKRVPLAEALMSLLRKSVRSEYL